MFPGAVNAERSAEERFASVVRTDMNELPGLHFTGQFRSIKYKTIKTGTELVVGYDRIDVLELFHF